VVDWANKVLFVLEFKRPSGQRGDYRERKESRAPRAKMTLKASTRPSRRWRETRTVMELRMLEYQVDNLCGRHKWIVKTFNDNLKEFQVIE
jgi:hypothetical protein